MRARIRCVLEPLVLSALVMLATESAASAVPKKAHRPARSQASDTLPDGPDAR